MQEQVRNLKFEDIRSFGRIRARKRSIRQHQLLQDILPRYVLNQKLFQQGSLDLAFERNYKELWLEIGFGGAEHLIQQAQKYPEIGFIGSEPFEGGIIKALSAFEKNNIRNVRLYNSDVRPLLRMMPKSYLGRIFILFPDPWPKARHAKRRLFNFDFIEVVANVMKPQAELRIATDISAYAREIFDVCSRHAGFVTQIWDEERHRKPWAEWSGTRYESKALKQGRSPFFLTFLRGQL